MKKKEEGRQTSGAKPLKQRRLTHKAPKPDLVCKNGWTGVLQSSTLHMWVEKQQQQEVLLTAAERIQGHRGLAISTNVRGA